MHGERLDGIRALYGDSEAMVRTDDGNTEWFGVTSELRQGCVLSPLLFIVYIDRITREATVCETELNELLFADDQSLVHKEEGNLQERVTALDGSCD